MGAPGGSGQEGRIRAATLDNGLKVVIQEVHTAPLASVWCWYKVGSKHEPSGLTGISHWVEHMNFKGTTNIPRDQVKGIIERVGGFWNGYTWIDQTAYVLTATCDALDRMLFIEAERMTGCLYHPEDCESERTVIISELQGGENDPEQLLDMEVTAAAFKAHPYGHPTIGWLSDLQRMTREDLYGYYRRYYVPDNATLVIVGDVKTDEVLRAADRHFGRAVPGSAASIACTTEPEQFGERRVIVAREGTAAYLKLAMHAPAVQDPDFVPVLILDAVLTGAKGLSLWASFSSAPPQRSARLYRALVEGRLASSVAGALLPTEEPFLYSVSATATEGTSLEALEHAAVAVLDQVARDGITDVELARAKSQLRARMVFEADSVTNLGHQIGFFETVASADFHRGLPARIAGTTVEEVGSAATRLLRAARPDGGMVPASAAVSCRTTGSRLRLCRQESSGGTMTGTGPAGLAPRRERLGNGVVVLAKRAGTTPAVTINAALRGGTIHDPGDLPGLAYFLSKVIDRGTRNRTADTIAEQLDSRGVSLNVLVTRHMLVVSCTCLAEDFEMLLGLVGEVVAQPVFPEAEIDTRRGEIITSLRQDEDSPAIVAVETLFGLLYADGHPYGRRAKGTIASVGRIDRAALQAFHQTWIRPSSLSLAIVGDVEEPHAVDAAARAFGDWSGEPSTQEPVLPAPRLLTRQRAVIPMMDKSQADVVYGLVTISRSDASYHAFSVMNNILGQYGMGGRLGESIRERQGMAYYIFSAFDATTWESPLVIRAGVDPENVDRTVASIDHEIALMAAEGVTEAELADTKQHLIGSMPLALETNAGITSFLQTVEQFGLGLDYDRRLPDLIRGVTREEAHEVARRFLIPERAAVVVAGPYRRPE